MSTHTESYNTLNERPEDHHDSVGLPKELADAARWLRAYELASAPSLHTDDRVVILSVATLLDFMYYETPIDDPCLSEEPFLKMLEAVNDLRTTEWTAQTTISILSLCKLRRELREYVNHTAKPDYRPYSWARVGGREQALQIWEDHRSSIFVGTAAHLRAYIQTNEPWLHEKDRRLFELTAARIETASAMFDESPDQDFDRLLPLMAALLQIWRQLGKKTEVTSISMVAEVHATARAYIADMATASLKTSKSPWWKVLIPSAASRAQTFA